MNKRKLKAFWLRYGWLLKYATVIVAFGIFYVFLSEYNVITRVKLGKQIAKMEHDKDSLQRKIAHDRQLQQALQNDDEMLETFARETFFMKKANEDVFIVK